MSEFLVLVKPLGRYMCLMKHGSGFAQMVQNQIQNQVQNKVQNQVQTKSEPIKP